MILKGYCEKERTWVLVMFVLLMLLIAIAFGYFGLRKHINGREYYVDRQGNEVELSDMKEGMTINSRYDHSVQWLGVVMVVVQLGLVVYIGYNPAKELLRRLRRLA